MRTTVELPPALMRAAKARSAERGETLKALMTRAIAAELAMPAGAQRKSAGRVTLPLLPSSGGPRTAITNRFLEDVLAREDAAAYHALIKESQPRRSRSRR